MSQSEEFPNNADGDALRRLRKSGSDLSKPHEIDFYLSFKSRAAAQSIEERILQLGLTASIDREEGGRWTCFCTKSMVPTYEAITTLDRRLKNLCEEFGGKYQGWGAMKVE